MVSCKKILLYSCAITLMGQVVAAKELPDNLSSSSYELDPIVVTATKTEHSKYTAPASITVVDQKSINDRQSSNIKDILENIANLEFSSSIYHIWQTPVIRGVMGSGNNYLVDGLRQNYSSVAGNAPAALLLNSELLKSVEVKRGSSSALYGGGGIGGIISVQTKDPQDMLRPNENFGAKIKSRYNSSYHNFLNTISLYGKTEDFAFLTQGTLQNSRNIKVRDKKGTRRVNVRGKDSSGLLKIIYTPTDEQYISLSYSHDTMSFHNVVREDLDVKKIDDRITGAYHYNLNDYIDLKLSTQFLYRTYWYSNDRVNLKDDFRSLGLSLQNTSYLLFGDNIKNRLTYGVDSYYDTQKGYENGAPSASRPDAKSVDFGIFLQDEITIFDKFDIIPSARVTNYKRVSKRGLAKDSKDTEFTPSIIFQYRPYEWIGVFTSYVKAYRPPSMDELYTFIDYGPMGSVNPNPDLLPERSKSMELGLNINADSLLFDEDRVGLKIVYFDQKVKNLITPDVKFTILPSGMPYFEGKSANKEEVKRKGIEIEANYNMQNLYVDLSYGKTKGKDAKTGVRVGGSPEKISLRVAYDIKNLDMTTYWKFRHIKSYKIYDDRDNKYDRFDPYTVHSIGLNWYPSFAKKYDATLAFSVDNLLNKVARNPFGGYERARSLNLSFDMKF